MKLSDLKKGEHGIIIKVYGHGGFRKRIIEMGFIKGKMVEVLLNAPLQDPIKYKIMGYEISLRRDEANMIEVLSLEEAEKQKNVMFSGNRQEFSLSTSPKEDEKDSSDSILHKVVIKRHNTINVALVGNPNCGKTSLFNFVSGAHERVGNYSGVTVNATEGHLSFENYKFNIVDLPGTYSLSAYSPEEIYVRNQIIEKTPDIIINVIDSSNLERNLYLTTQLIDMNIPMVCALNMYDEFKKRGDKLDYGKLGKLFGVPIIPTVFKTGEGVHDLFKKIINVYEEISINSDKNIKDESFSSYRHIHLNHGKYIEDGIDALKEEVQKNQSIRYKYSTRYLSIKLLEQDKNVEKLVSSFSNAEAIFKIRDKESQRIYTDTKEDSETAIMDAKYGIIHGALQEAEFKEGKDNDTYKLTHVLDFLITNKYLGFPLFFIFLYAMFQVTFSLGQYPMDWIDEGISVLSNFLSAKFPEGPLKDMIIDGIIGGVGAVIVFLPQILILYFFISFMEDSGYMARAAFIMDKLMHKMGLHGKSFIPLIMGFGCNVPAIMATRTIESKRSRLITMLILPMMSCSARLPIYIMITGTFFALEYRSAVMISLYVIGIIISIIISRIFSKYVIKGEDTPFVMELPPYRFPTAKAMFRHTWEKGKQYLQKMGGIILVASIVIWSLGYFPHNKNLTQQEQQEQSYIGRIGKTIEPIFEAQGFDWKLDVSLVAGVGAKEIVASTIGVLYSSDDSFSGDDSYSSNNKKYTLLYQEMQNNGITPLSAYCYLLFVLLYFPCIATIVAIKNESGSWKWAIFSAVYTTILAWSISAIVYQVGSRLF